jgi:dimethylglycine dehydrogenase
MDFGHELLENDLDRVADRLEMAFDRMPALGRAGIKSIVNGPFTFGPDGNPMIGPVPGLKNYWTAVGVMAGFCQAGGVGLCLAEWMIEGEPSIDVWAMDIARFGEFATRDYGTVKSTENYERRFKLTFPNEELPAMRQQKTTAIYDDLIQKGAVMGASFGLEHALWFAESQETAHENPSFRRSNAFDYVANEVKAVRENVGMIEIANFSKHEITGSGAKAFLDYLTPITLPKLGRIKLTPLLTPKGKLYGDLSVANLGNDRYMLFGSGNAQEMHRRWIEKHLPAQDVHYANRTDDYHGLAISGPKSRALLQTLTRDNLDKDNFKFSEIRETSLAGVPVILVRLSFSGELGYEIYCKPVYLRKLHQAITETGAKYSLQHYGARALMSLRLEKGWGVWGSDYRPDFTAAESGLSAFINYQKESFIGKEATVQEQKNGAKKQLVTLVVNTDDIDCHADEAVFHNGECVGYVSSGGYAHWVQKSVVMAYVPSTLVNDQTSFEVEILGERYPAILHKAPLYDPQGLKMLS